MVFRRNYQIREQENLLPGTRFAISVEKDHSIRLQKLDSTFLDNLIGSVEKGALEGLLEEKEFDRLNPNRKSLFSILKQPPKDDEFEIIRSPESRRELDL